MAKGRQRCQRVRRVRYQSEKEMSKGERKVTKQEALQSQEREASKGQEGCQSGKEREVPKKGGEDMSEGNSEVSNLERERCQSQHPLY